MLAKTPLKDRAIAWLEEQNPSQSYEWVNFRTCACAQLAQAFGEQRDWWDTDSSMHPEWHDLNMVARIEPHTFGALLERLR